MDFPADIPDRTHFHPHGGWPGNELEEALSASLGVPLGGGPDRRGARPQLPVGAAAQRRRPAQRPSRPAHDGPGRPGLRAGLQLRGAVPPGRRLPHGLHHRARRGVRPRTAPAGRHRGQPGRHGRCSAARLPRWPTCAGPGAPRWTARRAAAGSGCSNRTGRTIRWTSSAPPPRSSRLSAWWRPPAAAWPPSRRPTRCCSSAWSCCTGRATPALPLDALGRALGRSPARWPVNLVVLDVAQDPVADWLRHKVRPFYQRA